MAGTKPGPARKSNVVALREGNPSRRPRAELMGGTKLVAGKPDEPRWADVFPSPRKADAPAGDLADLRAAALRCRKVAAGEWARVVPVLFGARVLSTIDRAALVDYCTLIARIDQAERDISRRGIWVQGDRGAVKNPCVTALTGMRSALKYHLTSLGLTPSARNDVDALPGVAGSSGSAFDG